MKSMGNRQDKAKMAENADYRYALELQERWNAEDEDVQDTEKFAFLPPAPPRSTVHSNLDQEFLDRTQNLVHPMWETLDPTPDVQSLFGAFDGKFFQARLRCVTLEWSKRMYSCAGICYLRKNRLGKDITIRLSEPLLKLRPRKDLVETLLHEMIHAYCFVLNIREGNGGHGPNFKKIMYGINKVAGTNITVYHTFYDEVNLYKQHWWRCNGICQNRSPFFGYVKRTCNRAPGPSDQWWPAHQEWCGGTFMKIKGPDKPQKAASKAKEKAAATGATDMRKFFPTTATAKKNTQPTANVNGFPNRNSGISKGGGTKSNGGGTMVLNPKTKPPAATAISGAFPPTSYPGLSSDPFNAAAPVGGNLRNVMSFGDLAAADSGLPGRTAASRTPTAATITGPGYSLNSTATGLPKRNTGDGSADRNKLRDIWSKRFADSRSDGGAGRGIGGESNATGHTKRRRLSSETAPSRNSDVKFIADEGKTDAWIVFDDDVMLRKQPEIVIALSSGDEDDEYDAAVKSLVPRFKQHNMTANERQTLIKREILDETVDLRDEDIILIDDEYDDNNNDDDDLNLSVASVLADTSVVDEFFGDDTLLSDFKRENDVVPSSSRYMHNSQDDIITCPVCQGKMKRNVFGEHLDGCTGIAVQILPSFKKLASDSSGTRSQVRPKRKPKAKQNDQLQTLRDLGYSEDDLRHIDLSSSSTESEFQSDFDGLASSPQESPNALGNDDSWRRHRQRNLFKTTRQCPVCAYEIEETQMNEHLDQCLLNSD